METATVNQSNETASLSEVTTTVITQDETAISNQNDPPPPAPAAPISAISTGAAYPPSMLQGGSEGVQDQQEKKDFETISLDERRKPRRVIHFSDGVMEEYSTDEEDGGEEKELVAQPDIDPKTLDWFPYIWYYVTTASFATYRVCDYMGERLAYFFGITSPKYAYALSEYDRLEEDEKEDLHRQINEREEHRDQVARREADRAMTESMQNYPEPGLPTSTH